MSQVNIVIKASLSPEQAWMSFVSWYSLKTFFQKDNFFVAYQDTLNLDLFLWTRKANVKIIKYRENLDVKFPTLYVDSSVILLQPIKLESNFIDKTNLVSFLTDENSVEAKELVCTPNDDKILPFINFWNDWDDFKVKDWQNNNKDPLRMDFNPKGFISKEVQKLWNKIYNLYYLLQR